MKPASEKQEFNIKFTEFVGVGPKQLVGIIRFFHLYQTFHRTSDAATMRKLDEIYELYYDQSHFIKEFKRYTGVSPRDYKRQGNDFGSLFLK